MARVVDLKITQCDYIERTHTLSKFYDDIRKFKVLTREEEKKMFTLYQTGTPSEKKYARDCIVNSNQRFVVAMAKRFGTNENILDLISEGNLALIDAMETFDMSKDARFMTWAVWYIRRALNHYVIKNGGLVKKNNLPKTYPVISQAINKFIQTEYRQPTSQELLDILNTEYHLDIKSLDDVLPTNYIYIDDKGKVDGEEENTMALVTFNSYTMNRNGYEEKMNKEYNSTLVKSMLDNLTPREQEIIKLSFGVGCDRAMELQEIARTIGMSYERVRQLKEEGMKKLKAHYKTNLKEL